jgi:hypothetical protein
MCLRLPTNRVRVSSPRRAKCETKRGFGLLPRPSRRSWYSPSNKALGEGHGQTARARERIDLARLTVRRGAALGQQRTAAWISTWSWSAICERPTARRLIRSQLASRLSASRLQNLVSVISELINNSVQHGPGKPTQVRITLGDDGSIRGRSRTRATVWWPSARSLAMGPTGFRPADGRGADGSLGRVRGQYPCLVRARPRSRTQGSSGTSER